MNSARLFYLWSQLTALTACSLTQLLTGGANWRDGAPGALIQLLIAAAGLFTSFIFFCFIIRPTHSPNPQNSANSMNSAIRRCDP